MKEERAVAQQPAEQQPQEVLAVQERLPRQNPKSPWQGWWTQEWTRKNGKLISIEAVMAWKGDDNHWHKGSLPVTIRLGHVVADYAVSCGEALILHMHISRSAWFLYGFMRISAYISAYIFPIHIVYTDKYIDWITTYGSISPGRGKWSKCGIS